jgi:hypothetical protein
MLRGPNTAIAVDLDMALEVRSTAMINVAK